MRLNTPAKGSTVNIKPFSCCCHIEIALQICLQSFCKFRVIGMVVGTQLLNGRMAEHGSRKFLFLGASSAGRVDWYYRSVKMVIRDGYTFLEREYG